MEALRQVPGVLQLPKWTMRESRRDMYGAMKEVIENQSTNHTHLSRKTIPSQNVVILAAPQLFSRVLPRAPLRRLFSSKLAPPHERLSLISRHLNNNAYVPLRTPFSIERESNEGDEEYDWEPITRSTPKGISIKAEQQKRSFSTLQTTSLHEESSKRDETTTNSPATEAANMSPQSDHPTLLIPGPIEFDSAVLDSMSHYSESHVGQPFVNTFGEVLGMLRPLFQTTDSSSQPFVISGSGTLGWDQVAANVTEPGDEVLVLHTGYFADSFADCFETYGVKATQLKAPIGERPQLDEVEKKLRERKWKVITVTHTDTSTGVLSEIEALAKLVHDVSPDTLIVVDGVCSVGCEDLRFDEWGLDVVITASQKAIGCPAGLSIVMASGRAIETFRNRKHPPGSYFASWKNWLPIMQNYEAKKPSYFATPSPQLIHALHTALTQLLSRPLEERFQRHEEVSQKVKKAVEDMGLKQLATKRENQASGMTAIWLPEGLKPPEILPHLLKRGVIFAGGLHKEIAAKYIRFGHMGVSVMDDKKDDIDKALKALKEGLEEVGYKDGKVAK